MNQESSILTAALSAANRGWPVFPCNPQDKSPLTRHGFKDATTDTEQICSWWSTWPMASIGMATGATSGVWVLDVDLPAGPESLARLEAEYGALPVTLEQSTGSGGRHLFFVWPEGIEVRNSAGKIAFGLDVRGAGGYVILAPSQHPNGNCYQWVDEGVHPAIAPAWLVGLALRLVQTESSAPEEIGGNNGVTFYGKRALEDECDKVRHTPVGERNMTLNEAAFALGQLVAGGEIARTTAEHNLSRAAAGAGLTAREVLKTIRSGLDAGQREPRKAPELDRRSGQDQEARDEDKAFYRSILPPPPPLPLDALHPTLAEIVEEASEAFITPVEVPFTALLALMAGCIGRSRGITIKSDWSEHANLFLILVADSGGGKSPCSKTILEPLFKAEARWFKQYQEELKAFREAKDARRGKKADEVGPAPEPPTWMQIVLDDATPEALTDALAVNPRGILWYRDEIKGLLLDLDKYSGKDGATKTRLMSAYDSGPWKVTRVNGARNQFIRHACLSLFGTIQPATLPTIFGQADVDSGFWQRLTFIRAEMTRIPVFTELCLSDRNKAILERLVDSLLALDLDTDGNPKFIGVTGEAKVLFSDFYNRLAAEPWIDPDAQAFNSNNAKLRATCLRLALNLHCAEAVLEGRSELSAVTADNMRRAIVLTDWIKAHQRQAWEVLWNGGKVTDASPLEKRVAAAILELENDIEGGRLSTAQITEMINKSAGPQHQVKPEAVGRSYSKLGLLPKHTRSGKGVAVPRNAIDKLRLWTSVTTATTVTRPDPAVLDTVTDVAVANQTVTPGSPRGSWVDDSYDGCDGSPEDNSNVWFCRVCGSSQYWVNSGGAKVCANCHPPVSMKFEVIDAGNTQTSD